MSENQATNQTPVGTIAPPVSRLRRTMVLAFLMLLTVVATVTVTYVLITIFEHKQESRTPFVLVQNVSEISTDPAPWGLNWPNHFDEYKRTAGDKFDGSSSAMAQSKLEKSPWLKRLYAGYCLLYTSPSPRDS